MQNLEMKFRDKMLCLVTMVTLWSVGFSTRAAAQPAPPLPADSLRIVAVIDGGDELHIDANRFTWVHKSNGHPTDVRINGFEWNPQEQPSLDNADGGPWTMPNTDLSGAVLYTLRGRGKVELSRDADGLIVRFEDSENGGDTYEVLIDFAQRQTRNAPAAKPFNFRVSASVDDTDEIWFYREKATWLHTGGTAPTVSANGRKWDVMQKPDLPLDPEMLPNLMDLQRAKLIRTRGRGTVNLEYRGGLLCLDFEDRGNGADQYEVAVQVPRFGARYAVRVKADAGDALLGASLKIYRFPDAAKSAGSGEDYAQLPGQRVFDDRGQCLVALEAGQYQFEVQHQPDPQFIVALKSGVIDVKGPAEVDLKPFRIQPAMFALNHRAMVLDDLQIRTTRPTGGVSWQRTTRGAASPPTLLLSKDQSYAVHAFGHVGGDFAAMWLTMPATAISSIELKPDEARRCVFRWADGTPKSTEKRVTLQFPDGQMEIPRADTVRFLTNRLFFNVAYSLAFEGNRKAVFYPRGVLLKPVAAETEIRLGGALHPVASAAVLQNENLGRPDAQQLWWDITLADEQRYLLDPSASKVDWAVTLTTPDGKTPVATSPLLPDDVQRLGNLTDTLLASATYQMDTPTPQRVSIKPETFVARRTSRADTRVPSYRDWNTRTYLAKIAREMAMTAAARQELLPANRRYSIGWWFNSGAVGGNFSMTMPIPGYLESLDWFGHPWAIAHEMMHSLGYGHTHEMDRLDRDVQMRVAQFQWFVADHPAYIPEGWNEMTGP